ncbi:MAG: hypothetical protein ABSE90_03450 [Verrucomicrobiota bacterium]|jgi:hypothetical protein
MRLNRAAKKHGALAGVPLKLEFFNPLSSERCLSTWLFADINTDFGRH